MPSPTPPVEVQICSPVGVLAFEDIKKVIRGTFEMPDQYSTQYRDNGHTGVDIAYFNFKGNEFFSGAPVQTVLSGKVSSITEDRIPYGNTVIIETDWEHIPAAFRELVPIPEGQSLYHLYSHMRSLPPLIVGQDVACGEYLGPGGQTGKSTGPHLHFELRYGPPGAVFPGGMAYYTAPLTEDEWRNYVEWRMSGTYRLIDPMLFLKLPMPIPTPSSWNIAP